VPAFPVIEDFATSAEDVNTTSHTIALPANIEAGDLLIAAMVSDGTPTLPGRPDGPSRPSKATGRRSASRHEWPMATRARASPSRPAPVNKPATLRFGSTATMASQHRRSCVPRALISLPGQSQPRHRIAKNPVARSPRPQHRRSGRGLRGPGRLHAGGRAARGRR
jgi:hypothetical protein